MTSESAGWWNQSNTPDSLVSSSASESTNSSDAVDDSSWLDEDENVDFSSGSSDFSSGDSSFESGSSDFDSADSGIDSVGGESDD